MTPREDARMRLLVLALDGEATGALSAEEAAALRWLLDTEAGQARIVADLAAVYTVPEDQVAVLQLVARARAQTAAAGSPTVATS